MANELLICDKVAIGYGNKTIVSDISFRLRAGETAALIGENGSGKSTLIKTLVKEIPHLSGEILIDGKDIRKLSSRDIARIMAIVMTGDIRPEYFTCYDMVSSGRYPYTGRLGAMKDKDREAVEEAMRLTGTWDIADRYLTNISDGQRQLVMLSRAIAQEPKLLILDEPTSFLDIRHKILFADAVRKLAREKQTAVLMSMHELDLVRRMSDRIIALKDKHIDMDGTSEALTEEYIKELFRL